MSGFRTDILPHRDRLYRLALAITLDAAAAEDITQDTMLRAWEHRDEWPHISNMEAWLTQICRRLAIDHQRRHRTESIDAAPHLAATPQMQQRPDEDDLPGQLAIIAGLVADLPDPQPEIVRLRHIEDLSYHDIALRLGLTDEQVRAHLRRARQRLREQFTKLHAYGL